jgi:predicted Co/Zn/Cd cation transporter (cation efflux family)
VPAGTSGGDAHVGVEARALLVSTLVGAGSAVLALVWGLLSGSRVIVFDGASSTIGLLLSVVALLAARAARTPGSAAFPYGRVSFVPAAVGIQGIARFAVSAYAIVDAVLLIRDGGDTVSTGSVIAYSVVIAVVCVTMTSWLNARRGAGDLVAVEAIGWRMATLLSAAILIGFTVVALLPEGSFKDSAQVYVDPVLVIVVSVIVLPAPWSMLRTMARELLEMAPPTDIAEPAEAALRAALASYQLTDPVIRMTKTGGRLYVEVDHLVAPATWTVDDVDHVRTSLLTAVASDSYETWLNLDITTLPPEGRQ